ncbi:MAG: HAMP domain-containing protein [Spirochaetes bacterium]|nr:HAMP domain-containing protein [Spirochaetota bacterium]
MKLSVRSRFTLLYIGTITLLFVAMFYFSYRVFSHSIFSNDIAEKFDREFKKRVNTAAEKIGSGPGPFVFSREEYRSRFNDFIGVDLLLNPAYGQLVDFPAEFGDQPLIIVRNDALGGRYIPLTRRCYDAVVRGETWVETAEQVFPYPLRVFSKRVVDSGGNEYLLHMGVSMENINNTLENILLKFLSVWPLLLAVISVSGYYFMKRTFRPVREMAATARSITAEDLSRRIPPAHGNDEIALLAGTLNEMIGRLQRSFDQVRQFSDDVAHELRTPVTVIRGEIEVALRSGRGAEEYAETLRSLREESERLSGIIDNLLFLSRMDTRRMSIAFSETELDSLVMEVYEENCGAAGARNIALTLKRIDEITIRCEPGLMRRLLSNLIQNAVKYTPEGGSVEVTLKRPDDGEGHGMKALFIISDTGIGIPRKDLPLVFDRFYRVDKSRSGKTGGSGLGLTIVKKILDLHGGKVTVRSRPGAGTSFFLYFP